MEKQEEQKETAEVLAVKRERAGGVMEKQEEQKETAEVLAVKRERERALWFAVGIISTMNGWSDKHPDEVYEFLMTEAEKHKD